MKLPTGEVTELEGGDAWDALVKHFDFEERTTEPLPLDELPTTLELVPIEDPWRSVSRRSR